MRASQKQRASELFEALSPGCREAREKLQNLQRPTAHSAPSDIEKQQSYIAAHCPEVSRDGVWLADWEKGVSLKDAADLATVKLLPAPAGTPLRYGALSASDGGLWALDMAQLRYVRRAFADGALLDSAKTPGPAPQGAAWDGYNLWAFDAASGLVYKYALDPASGASSSYELEGVKSLVCMQWSGGRLWVLPYHVYVPSFGDWGFTLVAVRPLAPRDLHLPGGLRYATPEVWRAAQVFGPDEADMPADVNRLQSHALVGYYNAGWDAWFK